jgi:hypothetical protein
MIADDRVIEKKDRGAAEPLQFYRGRNRQLYEVVIFTVEKNKVTGYLSTPKTTGLTASQESCLTFRIRAAPARLVTICRFR